MVMFFFALMGNLFTTESISQNVMEASPNMQEVFRGFGAAQESPHGYFAQHKKQGSNAGAQQGIFPMHPSVGQGFEYESKQQGNDGVYRNQVQHIKKI